MHVNLDFLNVAILTVRCCWRCRRWSSRRRATSSCAGAAAHARDVRHFRKHMDIFSRQVFTGPPENTRDHIFCAAKALR